MKVTELSTISRQLGNRIIEMRNSKYYGYTITAYRGYTPTECELVNVIDNPVDRVMSIDTAYDLLFGAPQFVPDFTKAVTL